MEHESSIISVDGYIYFLELLKNCYLPIFSNSDIAWIFFVKVFLIKKNHLAVFQIISCSKKLNKWRTCTSLFFNKVAISRPATLWKRNSDTSACLWKFCQIFQSRNLSEHLLHEWFGWRQLFNAWCSLKGHTYLTNLQLLVEGLCKYVWPFSGNQAIKR